MHKYKIPEKAYIHSNELSQFIYIQVPLNLVVSECFSKVSGNAKILYGLLLNRTGLSVKNGWEDENGRTYIYYTVKDVMADLHVSKSQACRLFSELTNIIVTGTDEEGNEIWLGLVEKVRALNKPSRIYVHKVEEVKNIIEELEREQISVDEEQNDQTFGQIVQRLDEEPLEKHANTGGLKYESTVVSDMRPRTSQIRDHGRLKYENTDVSDMIPPSSQIRDVNNNYINNNYLSNNNSIYPINQNDTEGLISCTREMIRDNVEYDVLISDGRVSRKKLDDLIEIMVEACVLGSDLKIGGRKIPHSMIQSRFEKYDRFTMEYVLGSLSDNTTDVKNVKQYLLTTLYNAPVTMENHLSLMVQHDLSDRRTE